MNPHDFSLAEAVIYVKDPFDSPSTDLRGVPECEVLFEDEDEDEDDDEDEDEMQIPSLKLT